jgi:hypothetical protein
MDHRDNLPNCPALYIKLFLVLLREAGVRRYGVFPVTTKPNAEI